MQVIYNLREAVCFSRIQLFYPLIDYSQFHCWSCTMSCE